MLGPHSCSRCCITTDGHSLLPEIRSKSPVLSARTSAISSGFPLDVIQFVAQGSEALDPMPFSECFLAFTLSELLFICWKHICGLSCIWQICNQTSQWLKVMQYPDAGTNDEANCTWTNLWVREMVENTRETQLLRNHSLCSAIHKCITKQQWHNA